MLWGGTAESPLPLPSSYAIDTPLYKGPRSLIRYLSDRRLQLNTYSASFAPLLYAHSILSKNGLSHSFRLRGHGGCVNTLRFSHPNRSTLSARLPNINAYDSTRTDAQAPFEQFHSFPLLISGSDDQRILLWNPLDRLKLPFMQIQTPHRGNIFTAVIDEEEKYILSGANDGNIVRTALNATRDILIDPSRDAAVFQAEFLFHTYDNALACYEAGTIRRLDFRASACERSDVLLTSHSSVLGITVHPSYDTIFAYASATATQLMDLRKLPSVVDAHLLRYKEVLHYTPGTEHNTRAVNRHEQQTGKRLTAPSGISRSDHEKDRPKDGRASGFCRNHEMVSRDEALRHEEGIRFESLLLPLQSSKAREKVHAESSRAEDLKTFAEPHMATSVAYPESREGNECVDFKKLIRRRRFKRCKRDGSSFVKRAASSDTASPSVEARRLKRSMQPKVSIPIHEPVRRDESESNRSRRVRRRRGRHSDSDQTSSSEYHRYTHRRSKSRRVARRRQPCKGHYKRRGEDLSEERATVLNRRRPCQSNLGMQKRMEGTFWAALRPASLNSEGFRPNPEALGRHFSVSSKRLSEEGESSSSTSGACSLYPSARSCRRRGRRRRRAPSISSGEGLRQQRRAEDSSQKLWVSVDKKSDPKYERHQRSLASTSEDTLKRRGPSLPRSADTKGTAEAASLYKRHGSAASEESVSMVIKRPSTASRRRSKEAMDYSYRRLFRQGAKEGADSKVEIRGRDVGLDATLNDEDGAVSAEIRLNRRKETHQYASHEPARPYAMREQRLQQEQEEEEDEERCDEAEALPLRGLRRNGGERSDRKQIERHCVAVGLHSSDDSVDDLEEPVSSSFASQPLREWQNFIVSTLWKEKPLLWGDRAVLSWDAHFLLVIRRRKWPLIYATNYEYPIFELYSKGWKNISTLKSGCWLADDRHVAIGSEDDNRVHVWRLPYRIDVADYIRKKETKILRSAYTLSGHSSYVNCCASTPPMSQSYFPPILATSGMEKMIRIWTIQNQGSGDPDNAANYLFDNEHICEDTLEDMDVLNQFPRYPRSDASLSAEDGGGDSLPLQSHLSLTQISHRDNQDDSDGSVDSQIFIRSTVFTP